MATINIDTSLSPDYQTSFNETAVNPVANQIFWVFNTDASGDPNAFAKMILRFGNLALPAGDSLTITRYGGETSFVSRNNPTLYEFNAALTAISNALPFSQMLAEHPNFKPYYTVVFSSVGLFNYVTITARYSGAQYNLGATVSLTNIDSIFPNVLQLGTSATVGAGLTDFNIKVKLFINTALNSKINLGVDLPFVAGEWQEQPQLLQAQYAKDNVMAIDLAESLAPFTSCPPPNLNTYQIYTVQDMLVKYYFDYYASYIPDGEVSPRQFYIGSVGKTSGDEKLYAIHSGMPTYTQPVRIHNFYKYFWQRLTTADKVNFLTGCPTEKVTHVDSYEYLYWVYYSLGKVRPTVALRYDLYFEDGTELLNQDTLYTTQPRDTVYCAQVGYAQIRQAFGDVEITQGSLLRKFTVTVVEDSAGTINEITLPQTFVMDNTTRCFNFNACQLLFKNPYGTFDNMRFSGYYERQTKTTTKAYYKQPTWRIQTATVTPPLMEQLPIDTFVKLSPANVTNLSPVGLSTSANYDSVNETTFVLKTGWIRAVDMDWLKNSLFSSNEAYLVNWTDPDNLGNPNFRLMRRVVFGERQITKNQFDDTFNIQITVTTGMPDNALNG